MIIYKSLFKPRETEILKLDNFILNFYKAISHILAKKKIVIIII